MTNRKSLTFARGMALALTLVLVVQSVGLWGHSQPASANEMNNGNAPRTPTGTPTSTPTATPPDTSTSIPSATPVDTVTPAQQSTTLIFATEGDAYVQETNPAANIGTATNLVVDGEPDLESYFRFTVSGLSGSVQSAKLRVYNTNNSANGPAVYGTDTNWTETGITWNSRPTRGATPSEDKVAVGINVWVEYDVTPLVGGNGTYSFVLVPTSTDSVSMSSREGGFVPELEVTTLSGSGSTSTPSPTGSAATPTATPVDTTPPTVSITSPLPGTTYQTAQTVVIAALATDNVGVTRVEFYDNGVYMGSEDTSPFAYSWAISSANNGAHRWTARAFDPSGNSATSQEVLLNVNITGGGGTGGTITASVETDPVHHSGDAADDPAVWVHPTDPSLSTIIGTDKLGGLAVYDLSGNQLYYYADSRPNNVDIRFNVPLGGQRVTIVATSSLDDDAIRLYKVNPSTRGLEYVAARTIGVGIGLYGLCMYHSPTSGKYYVFDNDNSGNVQQWEIFDNGAGRVDASRVRSFSVGSTTEGCVADDELSHFYISEEDVAIWKYGAEPGAGTSRTRVDHTGSGGNLTMDIEGLAIYYAGNSTGRGYLIASSQGSNNFVVYERQGANNYLKKFNVIAGSVDEVSYTDGLDVMNFPLGPGFSEGVFIAQDDRNNTGNQNFKLVPWGPIARSGSTQLVVDTSWDPRRIGATGGSNTPTPGPATTNTPVPALTSTRTNTPALTPTATSTRTATPASTGTVVASGRTFYVDDVNGNDSNTGTSPSAAWRSLTKANSVSLAPGDRLLFKRGGVWTGKLRITRSGTSANPITVGSYWSGSNSALPKIQGSCIELTGSYVVMRELHTDNCSWAGIEVSGSYNIVQYNLTTNNVAGMYIRSGAQYNSILNNTLRDNNRMSILTLTPTSDDSGAFGLLMKGDYNDVAYNTISGSDAFSYDYGRDGAAIEIDGGRFNHFHHNLAVDNDAFTELGDPRASDNVYAYNVVRSSLATSTFLVTRGSGSGYGPVLRTQLYNNTVLMTGAQSQGFICHAGCGSDILRMRNNIVQAVWKAGYADAPFDEDYNLYFGGITQFTRGAHSLVADPGFLDPIAGNLRLRPSSRAVDAGVELGLGYITDH